MPKRPNLGSPHPHGGVGSFNRTDTNGRAGLLTVLLVVLSLVMLTVSSHEAGSGFFTGMRSVFQTVTTPVRLVGYGVSSPFVGLGNAYRNLTADEATLTDLEEKNRELNAQNVELKEYQLTAERLQDLLGLQNTYNLQSTAATVIGGSTDSWTRTVTLDKGSNAGISVGMPVFDSAGTVGQVIQVSATTSTVRLLRDENSSVSAMIQSSRAQGMVEGSADGTLHLNLIRTDQTVNVGDTIVTSGLGGVFPKGLPLGKVTSVSRTPGALYYDIVVEPFSGAGSGNYEEVLVVTSLTDGQQATAEDIEEADGQETAEASANASSSSDDSDSSAGAAAADSTDAGSSANVENANSSDASSDDGSSSSATTTEESQGNNSGSSSSSTDQG